MGRPDLDPNELRWLTGLARALVADRHAADDLAQDAALAALRPGAGEVAVSRPWLASVLRRLAARRVRDAVRRRRRERRAADTRTSTDEDPLQLVLRAERAEQLARAARDLPEPMRTTVLLRFLEDRSVDEIAARLGRPADTVRYRLRRGLELLRRRLGAPAHGPRDAFRRAWLPLAGVSGPIVPVPVAAAVAAPAATPLVAALMTTTHTKLLAVAAVAAALAVSLFCWLPDADVPVAAGGESAPSAARAVSRDPAVEAERSSPLAQRSRDAGARPGEAPSRVPAAGLPGRVVDAFGAAVARAEVTSRTVAADGAVGEELQRVLSGADGRFELAPPPPAGAELLVVRNGYRRSFTTLPPRVDGEVVVRLEVGAELVGRVVDGVGRGVAGLDCIAYREGAPVEHVSPSQVRQRALRAARGPRRPDYEHCLATTAGDGSVRFGGLGDGPVCVRSLQPAWRIDAPRTVATDGGPVVWTAVARFGVEVEVVGASGERAPSASARFRVEVVDRAGRRQQFGQWVGRGPGAASFALDGGMLPVPLDELVEVVFYGDVDVDGVRVDWRAEPLFSPGRTAQVRVFATDASRAGVPAREVSAAEPEPEPVLVPGELVVTRPHGGPVAQDLAVSWRVLGASLRGSRRLTARSDGRHALSLPAGRVELDVHAFGASGSLPSWTEEVFVQPGRAWLAAVELRLGGAVELTRPDGIDGAWSVRASLRERPGDDWRGSWNYGTSEPTLVLRAMAPAEWRFELRRSERDPEPLEVRRATVVEGRRVTVSR